MPNADTRSPAEQVWDEVCRLSESANGLRRPRMYDDTWKDRTMKRLGELGYGGFTYASEQWWTIDKRGRRTAGPFVSPEAFNTWLTEQEAQI